MMMVVIIRVIERLVSEMTCYVPIFFLILCVSYGTLNWDAKLSFTRVSTTPGIYWNLKTLLEIFV